MALSIVLRIKRTMNGTEIHELLSDVQARKARAIELLSDRWPIRCISAGGDIFDLDCHDITTTGSTGCPVWVNLPGQSGRALPAL